MIKALERYLIAIIGLLWFSITFILLALALLFIGSVVLLLSPLIAFSSKITVSLTDILKDK